MIQKLKKFGAVVLSLGLAAANLPTFPVNAAGVTDLYVGYASKANNFATVQEAVNKAASINPKSESERVKIHIAPGTYREQVVVQTPYVSFINDEPSEDVLLTWYYGIGYKYYSVNDKGFYDANSAKQTSVKNTPSYRWGATVQLRPQAQYFKAEHITFENSFNRYLTNEELKDGVELTGDASVSNISFQRKSGTDVKSKAATERAAALSADAAYSEFYACDFLSSQDTLYTGGSPQYYKDCYIEGNTDYIFGDCSAVFDSCELSFYGYSDNGYSGYITAARDDDNDDSGYLFNNCTITTNGSMKHKAGYLGRPWRDSAKVMFINTSVAKDGIITPEGWTKMSGVEPQNVAGFKEYGTKLVNGTAVDLSKRLGHKISEADASGIKLTNYMKNWTPTYLSGAPSQDSGNNNSGSSTTQNAITLCGGWYETAYAEWDSAKIGNNVQVSYKSSAASSWTNVDKELIRGNRVDIPGLKGGQSYTLQIKGSAGISECTVTPMAYDRSGYAHWKSTDGVGAYNNDGTLKAGVTVVYVTDSNKDTVTYGGQTGLYNIFYKTKPENVCFRIIGKLGVPKGAKANDGKQNDGSSMLYLQNGKNVTIEGIGYDAALDKWGFEMKRSTSCEVRNLWLGQYPDDGISMSGSSDNRSSRIWIHNNTIEKGYNAYAGNGTVDADKADGDGSVDIKWSDDITISYNVFDGCHKTSLVGGGTSHLQDRITYHHNWFKGTESRNPRARNGHVHSYNNYFTNNKQYGIGASYNSKVFSEANYFEKTNLPLDAVNMGSDAYSGTIKSFNDKFDGCTMGSGLAYKIVSSRTEKASINNLKSGGDAYDNFDLSIYSYTPQTADNAKKEVMNFAGRMMQKAYGSSAVNPGNPEIPTNPPTNPPAPVNPVSGEYFSNLTVNDTAYASLWSVEKNLTKGAKIFNDREFVLVDVPAQLEGLEYIRTACDSKKYADSEAEFTAAKDMTVYLFVDSRVEDTLSWLSSWTKTTLTMTDNGEPAVTYSVYSMDCKKGQKVTLGAVNFGSCVNYFAAAGDTVKMASGDVNSDGTFSVADLVMLEMWLLGSNKLNDWNAGDLCKDNVIDVYDLILMRKMITN